MRRYLMLATAFVLIGCGSSSASPEPGPSDAGTDSASDGSDDAQPDVVEDDASPPDSGEDAEPDSGQDAEPDGGEDAGPPTGELLLQGGPSDRVVPHVAARDDGTAFLAWYALAGSKYEVRMQRLDTSGQKLWGEDGILASDAASDSWVMDYDLVSDGQGNAVLLYSDTFDFELRAQRFDDQGNAAWGQGTVLNDPAADAFTPHAVAFPDGSVIVAWDEVRTSGEETSHVMAQRVDASGQVVWAEAFSVDPEGDMSPAFSQLVPSVGGGVIITWVENGGVNYPGDAYAQRVDADGNAMWSTKTKINGSEQLPFPMRPMLAADGEGGFYAAWSGLKNNGFYGRVQHVDANGVVSWDAEGVPVSTDHTMMHMPAVILAAPGSTRVAVGSKRTDANQSTSGLVIQGFDSDGVATWDDPGVTLVPASQAEGALAAALRPTSDGLAAFYAKGPTNTWDLTAHVASFSLSGAAMPVESELSGVPSEKLHPAVSDAVGGGYWLVWEDLRDGVPAIWGSWWPIP